MPYKITFMTEQDVDNIVHLEKSVFAHPFDREILMFELNSNPLSNYLCLKKDDELIGYCGLWIMYDEAQITNFAIYPQYQNQGIGTEFLENILEYLESKEVKELTLEVRVSNDRAIKVYTNLGFTKLGVRKKYYSDNNEDAYILGITL